MPHGCLRWGWVNVEDDLRSWGRPLQVSAHPNPQLVDVSVLSIIGGDGQRVRDGQELGEASKRVRSLPGTKQATHLAGLLACNLQLQPFGKLPGTQCPALLLLLNRGAGEGILRNPSTLLLPFPRGFFSFFFPHTFTLSRSPSSPGNWTRLLVLPKQSTSPSSPGCDPSALRGTAHGQAEEPGRELAQGTRC